MAIGFADTASLRGHRSEARPPSRTRTHIPQETGRASHETPRQSSESTPSEPQCEPSRTNPESSEAKVVNENADEILRGSLGMELDYLQEPTEEIKRQQTLQSPLPNLPPPTPSGIVGEDRYDDTPASSAEPSKTPGRPPQASTYPTSHSQRSSRKEMGRREAQTAEQALWRRYGVR